MIALTLFALCSFGYVSAEAQDRDRKREQREPNKEERKDYRKVRAVQSPGTVIAEAPPARTVIIAPPPPPPPPPGKPPVPRK